MLNSFLVNQGRLLARGALALTTGLFLTGLAWAVTPVAMAAEAPAPSAKRLLVIAPAAFHPALAEFVAHKRPLLPTDLRSLETVLAESSGVDDPEKLKRYLYREWHDHGLGYALLVGDVDVMPVRFMVLDRVTPAAYDYAFYPSDLYYADLAKRDGTFDDWNAQKESFHAGYFGEVRGEKNKSDPINYDGIDYLPEIGVGRWPVSTARRCHGWPPKPSPGSATFCRTPFPICIGPASWPRAGGWTAGAC